MIYLRYKIKLFITMSTVQLAQQKSDIIAWLTRLDDTNLIANLYALSQDKVLHLQPAQIDMLKMSDSDIVNGRLISDEELNKQDKEWLY